MKLASVWFDDMVVIPLGKATGAESRADLRDQSFHAVDGWDVREILPGTGTFSICREGMPSPATVGGYGYSFVQAEIESVEDKPRRKK